MESRLREITGISKGEVELCRVPLCPPRTCRQQKILSSLIKADDTIRCWPFTFHPNQLLESLLTVGRGEDGRNEAAKPYFTSNEIKW